MFSIAREVWRRHPWLAGRDIENTGIWWERRLERLKPSVSIHVSRAGSGTHHFSSW